MKPCLMHKPCCSCPMNGMIDCMMMCPCCTSSATGGMQSPCMAKMMQPLMRYMMNTLMKVTPDHDNDPTYKEVQDFMVPSSVGNPFLDKPGTFDEKMEPRIADLGFSVCCVNVMRMKRTEMIKQGAPHNKGITFDKFKEHRGYAMPGYEPKHPKPGDAAPGGAMPSSALCPAQSRRQANTANRSSRASTWIVIVVLARVCFRWQDPLDRRQVHRDDAAR